MKEFNNIYLEYNIDVNRLTRDYQKFPLKKFTKKNYEKLPKEDFVYLYIDCNLPRKVLEQYLNVTYRYINSLCKLYDVKKSQNQMKENRKKSYFEKYGVEHYSQTNECKEKKKQTCIKKYGVENISQLTDCKEKKKQTYLKHYGVESYTQTKEYKEKSKQTCLKKYGVDHYSQSNEFKNLYKDKEFVKHKLEKEYESKKRNNSFGKSKEEDKIYDMLSMKFKEVIRQYKSELYPFPCDFYIPCLDLYIEYQGYFQHGTEPYLGTDLQKEIVNHWEEKGTEQYLRAIKTWTINDPYKRTIAKKNNLNLMEFFNMNEFIKWFESI